MPGDREKDLPKHRAAWRGLAACGAVVVAAAVIAGFAWAKPTGTTSTLSYVQSGQLSYGAAVSRTSVYGSAKVTTGEPVYTTLVSTLTVAYRYRMSSASAVKLGGTEALVATIGNGQGITRTIPLQSPTSFRGAQFVATGTLSLSTLRSIASQFAGTTGGGGTYEVAISPNVKASGVVGGVPLRASFDPPVRFTLTSDALTPTGSSSRTSGASFGATSSASTGRAPARTSGGLTAYSSGSLRSAHRTATTLFGFSVLTLRIVSLAVLAGALALGALFAWPLVREFVSEDERRRIVARYGQSIIETGTLSAGPSVVVVELSTFDGLLQVARQTECPLLHASHGDEGDVYGVVDNGTFYRYSTERPAPSGASGLVRYNGNAKTAPMGA